MNNYDGTPVVDVLCQDCKKDAVLEFYLTFKNKFMDNKIKITIIICLTFSILCCLFLIASVTKLFFNRPVAMEECWNDGKLNTNNLYCKGFNDGYNWQRTQVLMDCNFANFN